jgi:DNA mismatch repair ATPase MutL
LQTDFSALADSSIKATPLKAIAKKHGVPYVAKEGLEKNRRAIKRAVKKLLNQAIAEAGTQLAETTKKPKATKPKPKATKRTKPKATKRTKPKATKPKTTKSKTTKPKTTKRTKPKTTKSKTTKRTKRRKQASDLQSLAQLSVVYPGLRGDISEYLAHNL